MKKKTLLIILDGWGIAQNPEVSAIDKAHTPFVDSLYTKYAHSQLEASGLAVGLPQGQMGNSEVGHMNIGAGRVVFQDLVKINNAVQEGTLADNLALNEAIRYAKTNKKPLHLLGLVSDGGIHSHIDHLKGLLSTLADKKCPQVYVHAFTDGRDTDPKSGIRFIEDLQAYMKKTTGTLASVCGRYYAMDRDKRWERVKKAYDLLTAAKGHKTDHILEALAQSYDQGITDEFIEPLVVCENDQPRAVIHDGDAVLCFNFRTDRGRQITEVLTQNAIPEQAMKPLSLHYTTLTQYDALFQNIHVMYGKENLTYTLGAVLAQNNKKQIRIAETEKYPHVTFFFSGGREEPFEGEKRILCPSPKVATYDLQPEMSAHTIKDNIIPELQKQEADFICLNFANPDMVGHTGVFEAAVKACETVDFCTQKVVEAALENHYTTLIIADHGNSDMMINEDGTPNTAHTTNKVPCILVDPEYKKIESGKLGDLAPTLLKIMGLEIPKEMTGHCLV